MQRLPDLQHDDGMPVTLLEWATVQRGLVMEFADMIEMQPEEVAQFWASRFAAAARLVCEYEGLETFAADMSAFQRKLPTHLANLKWFLSKQAQCDVGMKLTLARVHSDIRHLVDNGRVKVQLIVMIPWGDQPPGDETRMETEILEATKQLPHQPTVLSAAA